MKFHHLGLACKSIEETLDFLAANQAVLAKSRTVFDAEQQATLCMVTVAGGVELELISGKMVDGFVRKGIHLYHTCWVVSALEEAIWELQQQGALLISPPKSAVLFGGRRVAFLMGKIGMIELLEEAL